MKNAINKTLIILCVALLIILVAVALLWCGLNYYFVPKVVIPEIQKKIAIFNRDNKVSLKIRTISYRPLRGFLLEGVEFSPILTAKEIDIDLDYLALLSRKIRLPQIDIIEADLVVTRSRKGAWNYSPVLKGLFKKGKTDQPLFFDIDQINISRSQVNFDDQLNPGNRLTKHFTDVEIEIKSPDREDYFVEAAGADAKRQDAIRFKFHYSAKSGKIEGKAQLKLANLADYRDYYIDELISPLHLTKAQVEAQAEFSYGNRDRHLGVNAAVKLENLALQLEEKNMLEKGKGEAVITEKGAKIKKIRGISPGGVVDLSGQVVFLPLRRLDLAGKIGASDNDFHLKFLSDNSAQMNWLCSTEASYLNASADIQDIEKLSFTGKASGRIDLGLLPLKEFEAAGRIGFSGDLRGELDRPETLHGKLGLKFGDFSLWGLEPISFLLGMKVDEGEFSSGIPLTSLYGGTLSGAVVLDEKRWGIELQVEEVDLAKFAGVNARLAGLKGLLTARAAAVGDWRENKTVKGGGFFKLADADLKKASIFSVAQQGLESVVKGFQMPEFKEVKSNFEAANEVISFGNAAASAPGLELKGSGTIDFSGKTNFTMGVKFIQQHDLKTALYIFFPLQTLGFDLLTNTIKVEIKGVIPDLKQTTSVQALSWLTDAFDRQSSFNADQYTLDKLW
ncbi:hypothetical protein A2276_08335 [candidate division WOR-1 bacterium RIFOXYA12_FULL_43_27]|uniref:Uncharacterized protein n=1 Tax=candidate division WOR-1 bacterium RIFOXYC2_FULL_46_14 TaxID=1802587 RepID=A0A1F4U693_UNCSA|nr:MAG: hypothetical protein A2276_08335 [candidate division WOR-1 bacterium RIFOXYA12_FULL_43_27]OGC20601.1 MAG: hypothetical protein A2292_06160 [candidate division WOR-1 bacterium RIFOXYB2_FULL_46_45]OGC31662.1 MAG: hypothetical protein A2232_05290 [candidate division WOR-1 bacterium RIFOXYA2_FULL_46_56]OGC40442.1 MAG: hypothetical protein A2438_04190 [candidate division WOR-1 bacterium RIFOXYC2_FULL_46_14]